MAFFRDNSHLLEKFMNLIEHTNECLKVESKAKEVVVDKDEFVASLKLFQLAAENLDAFKKKIFYSNSKKYNSDFNMNLATMECLIEELCKNQSQEKTLNVNSRFLHGTVGMATESGELIEQLIDHIEGKEIDPIHVQEEIGDELWYSAIIHDEFKLNPEETLDKNIRKLKKRYGEKFSNYNAEHRNLSVERKELER